MVLEREGLAYCQQARVVQHRWRKYGGKTSQLMKAFVADSEHGGRA